MRTLSPALIAVALGAVAFVACGSSDDKRSVPYESAGAGAGGEAEPNAGGTSDGGSPERGGAGGDGFAGTTADGAQPGSAAGAGGEGGSAELPAGNDLYVSPTGSDADPGTEAEPYLTLAHAAGLAQPGDRIHLLDGTFDSATQPSFATNQPIAIPAGVTLMAENPGEAVLVGDSGGASVALEFTGSGELRDVAFGSFATAVVASAGTLAISGLSITDFGSVAPALELSGTAAVNLTPGAVTSYVTNASYFANLVDSATLAIEGGRFDALSGQPSGRGIFSVRGDAELTLSGVVVADTAGEVIYATDTAKVSLVEGTTIEGTVTPALSNIELQGESELVMNDATLTDTYWAHISTIGAPTLSIIDSTIENAGSWALIINTTGVPGTVSVNIAQSLISSCRSVLGQIDVRREADFVITGTQIVNGAAGGLFSGDSAVTLVLRDSTITDNGQSALRIGNHADSTCDLGTVADPGGNTLRGNGTSQPALLSYLAAGKTCFAVGNTWAPNVQNASATGTYSVSGAGAKLEITGIESTGFNYRVMNAGSILRLAENP